MKRTAAGVITSLSLVTLVISVPTTAAQVSNKPNNPDAVANWVSAASAGKVGGAKRAAKAETGAAGFSVSTVKGSVSIPARSNGKVVVSRADRGTVSISLGTQQTQPGKLASDGSVVYSGAAAVSQSVVAVDDGVRINSILSSVAAPTQIVYDVKLPAGAHLETAKASTTRDIDSRTSDRDTVLIVDAHGKAIAGFAKPWARDANGRDISTSYQVRGTQLIQTVNHRRSTTAYPVVADPWLGYDLIASASWSLSSSGWTLRVSPTDWARANGGGYLPGAAGWDELYSKYSNSGLNTNLDGMRDQYICHAQFAFLKETWNLDEWRPDVSYAETVAAMCNP